MNMNQQARQFRRHLLAFMKHQIKATAALQEINAICLLENEGNPLPRAIQGEDMLRQFARLGGTMLKPGDFSDIVDEAKKTLDANGYVV